MLAPYRRAKLASWGPCALFLSLAASGEACFAQSDFRQFMVSSPDVRGTTGAIYYRSDLQGHTDRICRDAVRFPNRLRLVDQEGGRVIRLPGRAAPPAASSATVLGLPAFSSLTAKAANVMRLHCVQINLAPVADVSNSPHLIVRHRSYSPDPLVAGRYASSFADSMRAEKIVPTWKHFPGHSGSIRTIEHAHPARRYFRYHNFEAALVQTERPQLFWAARSFRNQKPDLIMISQSVFASLAPMPAVLLPEVLERARETQPNSLLITDDLSQLSLSDEEILHLFRGVDLMMYSATNDVDRAQRVLQAYEALGVIGAAEIASKRNAMRRWRRIALPAR